MTEKKKENLLRIMLWLFALAVLAINFTLIFDNVLWGDEAFSANVVRDTGAYGIFQRLFYWDNHPPLYYYFLKLVAMIFGYTTPVYHLAAYITFALGVILACIFLPKKIGTVPTAFLVLFCGLSATCVEYNVEVRMYSMAFFFTGLTVYYSYKILNENRILYWVLMTVFAVLSAYSHYYGAMTTGIVIFYTSLFFFIRHKKKSWLYGVCSILGYFILYAPWLMVLYHHVKSVTGSWWMQNPDKFADVVEYICGGVRFKEIVLPFVIILSIAVFVTETGLITFRKGDSNREVVIRLNKPIFSNISTDFKVIVLCWCTIISEIALVYFLSYVVRPILAYRYTYMLVPLVITIFILLIKLYLQRIGAQKIGKTLVYLLFTIMLVLGLLDFKYFRSLSKVQDANLKEVLTIVGEPTESTVLADNGVPHLSYTVLQYYYPDTKVIDTNMGVLLSDIEDVNQDRNIEVDNIWLFRQSLLNDAEIAGLKKQGFDIECYEDKWFGKYYCDIYRIYKN